MRSHLIFGTVFALCVAALGPVWASEPSVLDVVVRANEDGTYGFDVTIAHNDEGWKHYADKYEVLGPDGKVLGERLLYHPHVNEQPVMRSLAGVSVPIGVTRVTIRAHDTVTGYGTRTITVDLPPRK